MTSSKKSNILYTGRRKVLAMRAVKETSSTIKAGAKTKSRKGSQATTKSAAKVQARSASPAAGSAGRKSLSSTGSGHK